MNTYKLGNKVNCIIRAFTAGKLGQEEMTYDNQPYTILKDIEVDINYSSTQRNISRNQNLITYDVDYVSSITLSNIKITDKILNLIYGDNPDIKLANTFANFNADENGQIFLSILPDTIYQVFIYDNTGQLEMAYGELNTSVPLIVQKPGQNYVICYSYECSKSVCLDRPVHYYVSLDLEVLGNINDETNTMWLHLDKCSLIPDKHLSFNGVSNTIDLSFNVLQTDGKSYLTLKE